MVSCTGPLAPLLVDFIQMMMTDGEVRVDVRPWLWRPAVFSKIAFVDDEHLLGESYGSQILYLSACFRSCQMLKVDPEAHARSIIYESIAVRLVCTNGVRRD